MSQTEIKINYLKNKILNFERKFRWKFEMPLSNITSKSSIPMSKCYQ